MNDDLTLISSSCDYASVKQCATKCSEKQVFKVKNSKDGWQKTDDINPVEVVLLEIHIMPTIWGQCFPLRPTRVN